MFRGLLKLSEGARVLGATARRGGGCTVEIDLGDRLVRVSFQSGHMTLAEIALLHQVDFSTASRWAKQGLLGKPGVTDHPHQGYQVRHVVAYFLRRERVRGQGSALHNAHSAAALAEAHNLHKPRGRATSEPKPVFMPFPRGKRDQKTTTETPPAELHGE